MGDDYFINGANEDYADSGTAIGYEEVLDVSVCWDGHYPYERLKIWSLPSRAITTCDTTLLFLRHCEADILNIFPTNNSQCLNPCPFSAQALSQFLTHSRGFPKDDLNRFEFSETQCRVLTHCDRTDLAIELMGCSFTGEGERVMLDGIQRNRGPSFLYLCRINVRGLANALRTNTCMETLEIHLDVCSSEDLSFLLESLVENTGIRKLVFQGEDSNIHIRLDENYCHALLTEVRADLNFEVAFCNFREAGERILLAGIRRNRGPSSFKRCGINTSLLANTLRGNSSIQRLQNIDSDGDVLALCRALAENLGLVYLNLGLVVINDENLECHVPVVGKPPGFRTPGHHKQ